LLSFLEQFKFTTSIEPASQHLPWVAAVPGQLLAIILTPTNLAVHWWWNLRQQPILKSE